MAENPSDDTPQRGSAEGNDNTTTDTKLGDEVWSVETGGKNADSESTTETQPNQQGSVDADTQSQAETESNAYESGDGPTPADEFIISRGSQTHSSPVSETPDEPTPEGASDPEPQTEQSSGSETDVDEHHQSEQSDQSQATRQQSPSVQTDTEQARSTRTQYWKPAALALTVATAALVAVLLTLGFFVTSRAPLTLILLSLFLVAWATARILGVYYIHKDVKLLRSQDAGYTPRRGIWTTGFFLSPPLVTYGLLTVYIYRRKFTIR